MHQDNNAHFDLCFCGTATSTDGIMLLWINLNEGFLYWDYCFYCCYCTGVEHKSTCCILQVEWTTLQKQTTLFFRQEGRYCLFCVVDGFYCEACRSGLRAKSFLVRFGWRFCLLGVCIRPYWLLDCHYTVLLCDWWWFCENHVVSPFTSQLRSRFRKHVRPRGELRWLRNQS